MTAVSSTLSDWRQAETPESTMLEEPEENKRGASVLSGTVRQVSVGGLSCPKSFAFVIKMQKVFFFYIQDKMNKSELLEFKSTFSHFPTF